MNLVKILIMCISLLFLFPDISLVAGDKEEIFSAIGNNNKDKLIEILKGDIELNYLLCMNIQIKGNAFNLCTKISPLHYAVYKNDIDTVKMLIINKADIDLSDDLGLTPLHYSVLCNNSVITKYLIEKRAVLNSKKTKTFDFVSGKGHVVISPGKSAFHLAVCSADDEIIKHFIANGADVNEPDGDGWSPLHIAVFNARKDILQILLEKGAKTDSRTGQIQNEEMRKVFPEGLTPVDLVKILLKYSSEYQSIDDLLLNIKSNK